MSRSPASDRTSEDSSPRLNISSMVDVAFLLLIFFLVTSTLQPREADLNMSLASEGLPPRMEPITIHINADNSVFWGEETVLDGRATSTEPLRQHLRSHQLMAASFHQRPAFVLRADDEASHQRLVDVVNAFAGEGVRDLLLAE